MMKLRCRGAALALALALVLGGCGAAPAAPAEESAPPAAGSAAEESGAGGWTTLEQADYLTREQKQLYRSAREAVYAFVHRTGFDAPRQQGGRTYEENGLTYRPCAGGRYSTWRQFYPAMTALFTAYFFEEKLNGPDPMVYLAVGDDLQLYVLDQPAAETPGYLGRDSDRFRLVSAGPDRIEFELEAHYRPGESGAGTQRLTNVLERADGQWRFSALGLPD